jgi:hypothetical protein
MCRKLLFFLFPLFAWSADFQMTNPFWLWGAYREPGILPLLPQEEFYAHWRPEFKLDFCDENCKLSAQPTLGYEYSYSNWTFAEQETHELRATVEEAKLELRPLEDAKILVGLLNYSWGPAELSNVSDPFFRPSYYERSAFYNQRGLVQVRTQLIKDSWTFEVAANPISNLEGEWGDFNRKYLVRAEKSFKDSLNYVGVTFYKIENENSGAGLYGNLYMTDVLSLYIDSRAETKTHYALVSGLRFEGFFDSRVEYLKQQNLLPHFLVEDLIALSFRKSELGAKNSGQIFLRYIKSLHDSAGIISMNGEYGLGDHVTIFLEPALSHGYKRDSFRTLFQWEVQGGLKATL